MISEYRLDDLVDLGEHIIETSRAGMAAAIAKLPQGSWKSEMRIDGLSDPIDLKATVTIAGDHVHVDYDGTSPVQPAGINCPICYTEAYTAFGIKCIVAPSLPNNAGTLDAVRVTAPEGCILNAPWPVAVNARSTMGHMLPDVVFGALNQAMPGSVPAEGTSNLWNIRIGAGQGITGPETKGPAFMLLSFHSGGAGARPSLDGLSATPFPSGVRNVPVEVNETIAPIVIWRKELRADSGGVGEHRGGLGQRMEISRIDGESFGIFPTFERVKYPARGREGGGPGGRGRLSLASGTELRPKGFQLIPAGERLIVEMPGGAGYGDPAKRDPAKIARDLKLGLVTE